MANPFGGRVGRHGPGHARLMAVKRIAQHVTAHRADVIDRARIDRLPLMVRHNSAPHTRATCPTPPGAPPGSALTTGRRRAEIETAGLGPAVFPDPRWSDDPVG
jgi:hypothetical protein